MSLKFTKVAAGHYATADGVWAVVVDGYTSQARSADTQIVGSEWAAVHDPEGRLREDHNAGENLDWFDTRHAAIAFIEAR